MKLYYHPFSPNSVMVHMTASYLGIPLEKQLVDLRSGEQSTPEFLKLNPNGKVPVLVDGSYTLWETCAIMQYLATKKTNDLWPSDELTRIDINRWQFWCQCHFIPSLRPYLYENFFKKLRGQGEPDQEAIKKAGDEFHRFAKVLENQLANHAYIVGNTLTLADITAAAYLLVYAKVVNIPIDDYSNITRWMGKIAQLPSWQDAYAQTQELLKKAA